MVFQTAGIAVSTRVPCGRSRSGFPLRISPACAGRPDRSSPGCAHPRHCWNAERRSRRRRLGRKLRSAADHLELHRFAGSLRSASVTMRRGPSPIATSHMTCDIDTFTVTSLPRTDHSPDSRLCASICWLASSSARRTASRSDFGRRLASAATGGGSSATRNRGDPSRLRPCGDETQVSALDLLRGADEASVNSGDFRLGIALAAAIGFEGRRAFEG